MDICNLYRTLFAPIAKKGSIELTTRQIVMLILMIIIAAIVILLGITYSEQAKTFLGNLMNSADKLV